MGDSIKKPFVPELGNRKGSANVVEYYFMVKYTSSSYDSQLSIYSQAISEWIIMQFTWYYRSATCWLIIIMWWFILCNAFHRYLSLLSFITNHPSRHCGIEHSLFPAIHILISGPLVWIHTPVVIRINCRVWPEASASKMGRRSGFSMGIIFCLVLLYSHCI